METTLGQPREAFPSFQKLFPSLLLFIRNSWKLRSETRLSDQRGVSWDLNFPLLPRGFHRGQTSGIHRISGSGISTSGIVPIPPQILGGFAEPAFSHFPEIQGKLPLNQDDPSRKRFGLVWSGSPRSCQRRFLSVPKENWDNGPCLCRCAGISRKIPQGAREKWEWREWE